MEMVVNMFQGDQKRIAESIIEALKEKKPVMITFNPDTQTVGIFKIASVEFFNLMEEVEIPCLR